MGRAGLSRIPLKKSRFQERKFACRHLTCQISLGRTDVGDFRWFLKADYGYDYYSIRFFQKLQRIQLGIVGDPASLIR